MFSLFGSGIGRGIAIGKAYLLKNSEIEIPELKLQKNQIKTEVSRFNSAVLDTEKHYQLMLAKLPKNAPKESAAFIEAHKMMLRDPLLVNESIKIIKSEQVNAEYALKIQ